VVIILRLLALATPGRGPTVSLDSTLLDIKRSVNEGAVGERGLIGVERRGSSLLAVEIAGE
jgi:hypothetical protein